MSQQWNVFNEDVQVTSFSRLQWLKQITSSHRMVVMHELFTMTLPFEEAAPRLALGQT